MGKHKQSEQSDAQSEGFVVSSFDGNKSSRFISLLKTDGRSKKNQVAILVAMVAIGTAIYMVTQIGPDPTKGPELSIQGESEVITNELDELKQQGLPQDATPEEAIAYYEKLATLSANTNDYKSAVTAFEKQKSLHTSSLDYLDHFRGAKYYCKVGDKAKANESLGLSQSLFPPKDDFNLAFYKDSMLAEIEFLKKECGL